MKNIFLTIPEKFLSYLSMTESSKRKFVTFRFPDNSFLEKYRLHRIRSWLSSALGDTKVNHSEKLNLQRVYFAEKYCKRQKKTVGASCDCERNARCNRSTLNDAKCDSLVEEGQWRNPQRQGKHISRP